MQLACSIGAMAFRLTYRRQCRYNTKSNKQRVVKTPGGKAVYQAVKKKAKGPHCGDCGKARLLSEGAGVGVGSIES